jgi:hypothetical protein
MARQVSRRERYQLRSKLPIVNTAAPPPRVTKDVSSQLSTASVATKTSTAITIPTLPPMQRHVELSKNVDNNYDDNNNDDNNDDNDNDKDYKGIDDKDEDNNDDDVDDDDEGGKCGPEEKPSMRVLPPGQGLYYRDDDALLDEVFDDEYDKKHFTSIPSEAA